MSSTQEVSNTTREVSDTTQEVSNTTQEVTNTTQEEDYDSCSGDEVDARSRSPSEKKRSRSRSPSEKKRSRSRSPSEKKRSRSRSPSEKKRSRSRSPRRHQDYRKPPRRHQEDRKPPRRHQDDRKPPRRHQDDRKPPRRHNKDLHIDNFDDKKQSVFILMSKPESCNGWRQAFLHNKFRVYDHGMPFKKGCRSLLSDSSIRMNSRDMSDFQSFIAGSVTEFMGRDFAVNSFLKWYKQQDRSGSKVVIFGFDRRMLRSTQQTISTLTKMGAVFMVEPGSCQDSYSQYMRAESACTESDISRVLTTCPTFKT
jgi:hypothetical protein